MATLRVHFMRNLLAHIPHGEKTMVAALLRTIFVQPNRWRPTNR